MTAIHHDPEQHQFTMQLNGEQAHLQYQLLEGGRVDFTSTFVPPALRGQGHARELVDAGFAWARQKGLRIEASCWYAKGVLEREAPSRAD